MGTNREHLAMQIRRSTAARATAELNHQQWIHLSGFACYVVSNVCEIPVKETGRKEENKYAEKLLKTTMFSV